MNDTEYIYFISFWYRNGSETGFDWTTMPMSAGICDPKQIHDLCLNIGRKLKYEEVSVMSWKLLSIRNDNNDGVQFHSRYLVRGRDGRF